MAGFYQALIGLGANLNDPIQQILDARVALTNLPLVTNWECSPLYVSTPVGYSDQPNFVNCVLSLKTSYDAYALFYQMQSVETKLGRIREEGNQNAPRLIDIDMLMFGDQQLNDPELIIPHPRIEERLFVIKPLADLGVQIEPNPSTDFSDQVLHQLTI